MEGGEPLALHAGHLREARLFAERADLVRALVPPGGAVAEVGVALGDFSEVLLEMLKPSRFVAVDSFALHELPEFWGRPTAELLGGLTHAEYYRRRLAPWGDTVELQQGLSWEALARCGAGSFDLVYVDAGHEYDDVRRDAEAAVRAVRPDGVLVFNDYVLYDHVSHTPYGVVQVVNRLAVEGGWKVVGFALHPQMFCDVALRRASR